MRRFTSMVMMASLLLLSCLPTASLAASCAMPNNSMTLEDMSEHHHAKPMQMEHQHDAALHGDWQTSRIECGCGCHRHLDGLPHAFSPHIYETPITEQVKAAFVPVLHVEPVRLMVATIVPAPPPRKV